MIGAHLLVVLLAKLSKLGNEIKQFKCGKI